MVFKKKFFSFLVLTFFASQNIFWGQTEFPASTEILAQKIPVLTLQECIDYAVKHADSVLAAAENQKAAGYRYSASKRKYLPEAYIDGNAGVNTRGESVIYTSANVVLPLNWGTLNADRRLAKNNMERTAGDRDLKVNDAILAVKDAYFHSLYAEHAVMNLVGSLYQLEGHLKVVNALYRSGNALKVDILKVQAQFNQEKTKLRKALGDQKYFKSFLNQLLHREMDEDFRLVEQPFLPLAFSLKDSYHVAEQHNPLFKILAAKKQEADLQVQKAKWSFIRQLGLVGKYQRQDASYVAPTDQNQWTLGFAGNVNVWDWGRTLQEVHEKQATARAELHNIDDEIAKHRIQIKRLYEDLLISEQSVHAAREMVRVLEEEYAAQKVRFQNGMIKTQDLLVTQAFLIQAHLDYEELLLERNISKARLQGFVGVPDTRAYEGGGLKLSDPELLDLIARKAFNYFDNEFNKRTGLFFDAAGGGDASVGAMGYGFAAYVIGVERGWISKSEAEQRILLALDSLLKVQAMGGAKEGMFYHFLDPETGERAGSSEVSLVDTALLLSGAVTAAEYFKGEVAAKVEKIYRNIHWAYFLSQAPAHQNEFHLGWVPEKGLMPYYWNAYTDETLLIILSALGSPQDEKMPDHLYKKAFRRKKVKYEGVSFFPSWSGGLFSYEYANLFFDFNSYRDPDGINWFENASKATALQIRRLRAKHADLKSVKEGIWGISAGELPNGDYDMMIGIQPNLMRKDRWNGVYVPSSVMGALEYVPDEALKLIRALYEKNPQLWGRYGFTSSFAPDVGWTSSKFYGLDLGLTLIAIDNYQHGTVRGAFMKSSLVQKALNRAGFKKAKPEIKPRQKLLIHDLVSVQRQAQEVLKSKKFSELDPILEQHIQLTADIRDPGLVLPSIEFYKELLGKYKNYGRRDQVEIRVADLYRNLGRFKEAAKEYERLATENPQSAFAPEALQKLGETYGRQQNVKQALQVFRQLSADYPGTVQAEHSLIKVGELYWQDGHFDQARQAWQEFLDKYPGSKERDRVFSLLQTGLIPQAAS